MLYIKYKMIRQKERLEMELKHSSLEKELDFKNYELMLTIRYLISKNEILTKLQKEVNIIKDNSSKYPIKNLRSMENILNEGLFMAFIHSSVCVSSPSFKVLNSQNKATLRNFWINTLILPPTIYDFAPT